MEFKSYEVRLALRVIYDPKILPPARWRWANLLDLDVGESVVVLSCEEKDFNDVLKAKTDPTPDIAETAHSGDAAWEFSEDEVRRVLNANDPPKSVGP